MEDLVPLLQLQMENGGEASLAVKGVSMMPMLISNRDRVWLKADCSQLKAGDVILYRRDNGHYVLHRIIKKGNPMICCGDNQWQKEQVHSQQLIAVVTSFERAGVRHQLAEKGYRCYTWAMVALFFLRRPYIALRRFAGRVLARRRSKS